MAAPSDDVTKSVQNFVFDSGEMGKKSIKFSFDENNQFVPGF